MDKKVSLKNKKVLIISPEAWGTSFVSKHHYASILAQKGCQVFFLNPPVSGKKIAGVQIQEVSPGLKVVDYPHKIRGLNRMPALLAAFFNKRLIKAILKVCGTPDIVWSFDPFRFQDLKQFGAATAIYHPVDIHLTKMEAIAAESADLVFGTSDQILNRIEVNPSVKYKINHGLAEHFTTNSEVVADFIQKPERVKVGYVGNLNYTFLDRKHLLEIILENKEVDFYFIGPYAQSNLSTAVNKEAEACIEQLKALPNTFLLGSKPSIELPKYLAAFDMFLMCYKGDRLKAQMANPHKILEYLSTGKVIVSHYIDEYRNQQQLVEMVEDNALLKEKFNHVVRNLDRYNQPELIALRKSFALANVYAKQVERIEEFLMKLNHD